MKNFKRPKKINPRHEVIKRKWYEENAPFGRELGYPECCIKEFCDQPPQLMKGIPSKDDVRRYKASHINGKWSGFTPCSNHAKQIIMGKITLESLIDKEKRNPDFFPFPNE